MNEITTDNDHNGFLVVNTLAEALKVAEIISKSSFCPKQFMGKAGDVLVCLQFGAELHLKPMQALQNISVINGRPCIWGDAMLAVCRLAKNFEYVDETLDETTMIATCRAKRLGEPDVVRKFSKADAELAKLWGKEGPWKQYPKRMLQMRARGFALRDTFPDTLRGIISTEEARDYPKADNKSFRATAERVIDAPEMPVESEPVISAEDLVHLKWAITKAEASELNVCTRHNITSLELLPVSKFDRLMLALKRQAEEVAETNGVQDFVIDSEDEQDETVKEFFGDE